MKGLKLLIVDDEQDIVELLAYNFEKDGVSVTKAYSGVEGLKKAQEIIPDVVLLDVMMPDMDGIEVCEHLRKNPATKNMIIIFLSARGEDYSQVAGYNAGCDDYVVKPLKIKLLKFKIQALTRRKIEKIETVPSLIEIDQERFLVLFKQEEFLIPKKEFELLALLLSAKDKVFRREEILRDVWGDAFIGDRTIDVHIRKLREKFGNEVIKTIKGVGYKFAG